MPGCTLQVALAALTVGQGDTYGCSCCCSRTFCCSHRCLLWASCKKTGSMPLGCRHYLSLIFWLQSQVTVVLSTFNMSSCLWKLQPVCMAGCARCLLVRNNVMSLICRAPGGSNPTLVAASLLPNFYNSCRCPSDCTGYSLAKAGCGFCTKTSSVLQLGAVETGCLFLQTSLRAAKSNRVSLLLLLLLFLNAFGNLNYTVLANLCLASPVHRHGVPDCK